MVSILFKNFWKLFNAYANCLADYSDLYGAVSTPTNKTHIVSIINMCWFNKPVLKTVSSSDFLKLYIY